MQIFLFVSGHSSELSIANHSSRPTASQLKCVSDTISNWFENHQPQKTQNSTVIYAPFIQNSNQMASRLTATTKFFEGIWQPLQFSRQRPSFSAHRATLMTNTDLIFPAFSSRFAGLPTPGKGNPWKGDPWKKSGYSTKNSEIQFFFPDQIPFPSRELDTNLTARLYSPFKMANRRGEKR